MLSDSPINHAHNTSASTSSPARAPSFPARVFTAGDRVRFTDATGTKRAGIISACFPDGICHVRLDASNRMISELISHLQSARRRTATRDRVFHAMGMSVKIGGDATEGSTNART